MTTSIITGITGQDGSYLAESLLNKGHKVYGIIRRSSSFNTERIDHIYNNPNLKLVFGDLSDIASIRDLLADTKPTYFYNLAAMSHVKVSFEIPEYTYDITGAGTLRLLEAIRKYSPMTRFYQASSSELYGSTSPPQNEQTPFHPRSPYGVAKLAAYWTTINYRESYNLFASNGVLFNHESVAEFMPVIFKEGINGHIQIKPISEFVRKHLSSTKTIDKNKLSYQEFEPDRDSYVWDNHAWSKVKFASAYPHSLTNNSKTPRFILSKNSLQLITKEHKIIMENGDEKEQQDIYVGDKVKIIDYPKTEHITNLISKEEAELLGFIVGDGSVTKDFAIKISGKDLELLKHYEKLWNNIGGNCSAFKRYKTELSKDEGVWITRLNNGTNWISKFQIYDEDHKKMIPWQVLNSTKDIKEAFLRGYMLADGLKASAAIYEYKGFCTNSATLAAGILFILEEITGQRFNINIDISEKWRNIKRVYYRVKLLSNSKYEFKNNLCKYYIVKDMLNKKISHRAINKETNITRTFIRKIAKGYIPEETHYKEKENNIIKKIENWEFDGWFYDLETESGTFHCGVGKGLVHNSPRRGETFVTRKVTRAVGRIKYGLQNEVRLGNLNAKRDWSHAKDYVEAMQLILMHESPDDFVIASGKAYSVKEFAEKAFALAELDPYKYIVIDPKYYRPAEVDYLLGDATKAKNILNWEPKISFDELVKEMVDNDLELARKEYILKNS